MEVSGGRADYTAGLHTHLATTGMGSVPKTAILGRLDPDTP